MFAVTTRLSLSAAALCLAVSHQASAQQEVLASYDAPDFKGSAEAGARISNSLGARAEESSAGSRGLVRIGFDTVEGAPRYAVRSAPEAGPAVVRFSAARPRAAGHRGTMPDRLPVAGGRLTSSYGYRVHPLSGRGSNHHGIDLAVNTGTPVVTTSAGEVAFAGWSGGYGLLVVVDHGGGIQTRYGHLSHIAVTPGMGLEQGQLIGRSGSTGRSTGPHVHYEVRVDGRPVDPLQSASL